MERSIRDVINLYNPNDPLAHAWTIPAPWYFDLSGAFGRPAAAD